MKWLSRIFMVVGIVLLGIFGFTVYDQVTSTSVTLEQAEQVLEETSVEAAENSLDPMDFNPETGETYGVLNIPKLDRSIGIVEGTEADDLKRGVGHISSTVQPGQGEQIALSGHRDTVFRDFDQIGIGDRFEVEVPYGTYEYEIEEMEIVDRYDTSVIREMGEEVLVVTTCYPFGNWLGYAPDRAVFYAYPVN